MKRVTEYMLNLTELHERVLERKLNYALRTPAAEIRSSVLKSAVQDLNFALEEWRLLEVQESERLVREIEYNRNIRPK